MRPTLPLASLAFVACAFAASGCNPPVVGEWRGAHKLSNGERNQLVVNSDGAGSAVVWATHPGAPTSWSKLRFDAIWEDYTEEFLFDMACRECGNDSFRMRCRVVAPFDDSAEKMDCTGDGNWTSYPFDWERVD